MRTVAATLLAIAIAACGEAPIPDVAPASASGNSIMARIMPLPEYFDCVRRSRGTLLAAHRGGPAPGYPENGLETLKAAFADGITVFEIDVAETRDGVLFLMHDRSLGRTTTGSGQVVDTDWDEVSRLRLVDEAGTTTSFHPPRLTDVLVWTVQSGAILELDRKTSTSFRNIISAVRAANAENNVIVISYDDDQAAQIAALAPDLMLTANAYGGRDVRALEERGVVRENLIAWTGTREPDSAAFARLLQEGVEPAFGTLGRPEERLDTAWLRDGDASEYEDLAEDGVVLIATDRARAVAAGINADDRALVACGR